MGEAIQSIPAGRRRPKAAWVAIASIVAFVVFVAAMAAPRSQFNVGIEIDTLTESEASILTRKLAVSRHSDRHRNNLPNVDGVAELCKSIQALSPKNPLYLYMGRGERHTRQVMSLELETAWKLFRDLKPVTCS